jgi:hypothetical protein
VFRVGVIPNDGKAHPEMLSLDGESKKRCGGFQLVKVRQESVSSPDRETCRLADVLM